MITEAVITAVVRETHKHCSRMEGSRFGALRCHCECGAVFEDKPEMDADEQHTRHWAEMALRAAAAAEGRTDA